MLQISTIRRTRIACQQSKRLWLME